MVPVQAIQFHAIDPRPENNPRLDHHFSLWTAGSVRRTAAPTSECSDGSLRSERPIRQDWSTQKTNSVQFLAAAKSEPGEHTISAAVAVERCPSRSAVHGEELGWKISRRQECCDIL